MEPDLPKKIYGSLDGLELEPLLHDGVLALYRDRHRASLPAGGTGNIPPGCEARHCPLQVIQAAAHGSIFRPIMPVSETGNQGMHEIMPARCLQGPSWKKRYL